MWHYSVQVLTHCTSILPMHTQHLRLPRHYGFMCVCTPAHCAWVQPVRLNAQHQRNAGIWYCIPSHTHTPPLCPAPSLPLLPLFPRDTSPQPSKPQRHQTSFIKSLTPQGMHTSANLRMWKGGHSFPLLSPSRNLSAHLCFVFLSRAVSNNVSEHIT